MPSRPRTSKLAGKSASRSPASKKASRKGAVKSRRRIAPKTAKAKIEDLKAEVRETVASGQALVKGTTDESLAARQIQIKVADLEAKAARAETMKRKPQQAATEQKLRKQIDKLRFDLKPARRAAKTK